MQHHPTPRRSWGLIALAVFVVVGVLAGAGFGALMLRDRDDDVAGAATEPIASTAGSDSVATSPTLAAGLGDTAVDATGLSDAPTGSMSLADMTSGSASVQGSDLVVDTGAGDFVLGDADLEVVAGPDGAPRIEPGVATIELPTVGALSQAVLDRPLRGLVGMATGAELAHLGAHLVSTKIYLYADLGTQEFDLFLGFGEAYEGAGDLPERISTAGATGSSMLVVDIEGDYFYLSTSCPAMVPGGSGSGGARSRTRSQHENAPVDAIPGVSLDLTGFDPGGCGFGWSASGAIPFEPMMPGRLTDFDDGFTANLVMDGTMPVHVAASVDGEIFYRFGEQETDMRANGELDVGLAFLKGAAEVTLPALRGSVGWKTTSDTFDMWVTATAGSTATEGTPSELLADLAPISGQVDIDGELHMAGLDVLDTSFLQLVGDISVDPRPIRTASDTPVEPVFAAEAFARIDSTGITVRGTASSSPLSLIDVEGDVAVEMLIPFAELGDSYLQIDGTLAIGGTVLGADASLRIDRDGARASGRLAVAGMAEIAVDGWLGPDGFQLTGSADVTLPIGDLDKVAATIVDQTTTDATIAALNADIDRRIDQIAASDTAKGTEVRNTVRDFRAEFDNIASIRETIAYNDGLIADIQRDKQADIDWHWALNDFDRFWDKGPHAIRQGAFIARIEALKLANSVQYGYIDVANSAVAAAQQVVIGIIGWDGELNASLTLVTEAYLGTLAGNVVATVLNGADAILDAFGIDGSARGTVFFTVGTEGVSGDAQLEWCRDGVCDHLAGARVDLAPTVRVCAAIVGVESCVGL
ncbi:MAG: hypothetical protein AAF548_17915 [Actinomycetota bacterium]